MNVLELMDELIKIAESLGVTIKHTSNREDIEAKAIYLPSKHEIIFSNTFKAHELPFVLAHELAHASLHNDKRLKALGFSINRRTNVELEAHNLATKWMLQYYLDRTNEPSYVQFMEQFGIPLHLEKLVINEMNVQCKEFEQQSLF